MTDHTTNIGIYSLKPNNQIMDYITGKGSIAITNPWIELPGLTKPSFKEYLQIKKILGEMPGYTIQSPQIVYRTTSNKFTSNIIFTEDNNELSLTTRFTPFKLWQTEIKDYVTKFKKMQKITCSRGKFVDTNEGIINECTINYQLTQAIELSILLKMFGLAPAEDTTDDEILNYLYSEFEHVSIDDEDEMTTYKAQLKKLKTAIDNYIKFNSPDNLKRYIVQDDENKNNKKAVINDIFEIFKNVMKTKSEYLNKEENTYKEYYNVLTAEGKNDTVKAIAPACFIKHFKTTIDNKQIEGTSVYTNYIFKCGEFGNTMTKKTQKGKLVPLTISDHAKMAGKSQIGKFFIKIDFDIRIYPKVATNSPTALRYDVKILLYRANEFSSTANIEGIDNIDIGMDEDTNENIGAEDVELD